MADGQDLAQCRPAEGAAGFRRGHSKAHGQGSRRYLHCRKGIIQQTLPAQSMGRGQAIVSSVLLVFMQFIVY
jgi:hypothetical protein